MRDITDAHRTAVLGKITRVNITITNSLFFFSYACHEP